MSANLRNQWVQEGYIVVPGLFSPERVEQLRCICEDILRQWCRKNPESGEPGGGPDATVMRHLNHPGYFSRDPEPLSNLMDAVADDRVIEICRAILAEPPLFRCTSLFMNPRETSSDGSWHRDSQFLHPDEEDEKAVLREGLNTGEAIQMQVALVPSDDVEFVPLSHLRWDTPEEYLIRRANGGENSRSNAMPGVLRVALQPGDILAFNPYGLHRGRYHADKPRRTLMLTYTRTSRPNYDYFSRQPWFLQQGYMETFKPKTRAFLEPFVQAYQEEWRKQGEKYG